jgi:hypothetical protein
MRRVSSISLTKPFRAQARAVPRAFLSDAAMKMSEEVNFDCTQHFVVPDDKDGECDDFSYSEAGATEA